MNDNQHIIYSPDVTDKISETKSFISSFGEIIEKDSGNKKFGFLDRILQMQCLDMDLWEKSISGNPDKTMDCAIGIADFDDKTRRHTSTRILLVELKLNTKSHKSTLGAKELIEKVRHSVDLLNIQTVDNHKIFIFPEHQRNIYANELSRWQKGSNRTTFKDWKILNPSQFNNFINFKEDFPYIPINSTETIIESLTTPHKDGEYQLLFDSLSKWKSKLNKYLSNYMKEEASHLRNIVSNTMKQIIPEMPECDDKELIKMEFQNIFDFSIQN